jgi:hypothetical protein
MFTEAISGTSSPRSQFRFWNTFRPSLRLKLGNLASKSGIDLFGVIKASKHYMIYTSLLLAWIPVAYENLVLSQAGAN